jgi:hypothetical protein
VDEFALHVPYNEYPQFAITNSAHPLGNVSRKSNWSLSSVIVSDMKVCQNSKCFGGGGKYCKKFYLLQGSCPSDENQRFLNIVSRWSSANVPLWH